MLRCEEADMNKGRKTAQPTDSGSKTDNSIVLKDKPEVLDIISKRLRNYFDAVAMQPLPDRFVELLNELERKKPPGKRDRSP